MTLKGRYDELMDRVQMTDEMRARVLEKVRQADLSAPEDRRRSSGGLAAVGGHGRPVWPWLRGGPGPAPSAAPKRDGGPGR